MNCREAIDVMDAALDDTLQPTLRHGFEDHMSDCIPCRNYLEQLIVTRKALRLLPPEEPVNPRRGELIDAFIREFDRRRQ